MEVYHSNNGSTGKISTSKGNQMKMKIDDYWHKMDYLGYEGLAEYLASKILPYTNIKDYAEYELVEMNLNGQKFNGCCSKDFLQENEEIVTADRLFKTYLEMPVAAILSQKVNMSLQERISYFVKQIEDLTHLSDYGKELTKMLEWDEFILNDDRHFNNIAFIYNNESRKFRPCTLFDNGGGFLSDMRFDYPLERNVYGLFASVKAKPFDKSFTKQTVACQELYGTQLKISSDIQLSEDVKTEIQIHYGNKVFQRIEDVFQRQLDIFDEYLYDCDLEGEL